MPSIKASSLERCEKYELQFMHHTHFTQIDPAKSVSDKILELIFDNDTDAIIVAGTQDVTEEKAYATIQKIANKGKPIYFAPSHPSQVGNKIFKELNKENIEALIIYHPVNSRNSEICEWPLIWTEQLEKQHIDPYLDGKRINIFYLVTNPESTVGKLLNIFLDKEELILQIDIWRDNVSSNTLYLDGSGQKVPKDIIELVEFNSGFPSLLVGGGIKNYKDADDMFEYGADAVNVGTILEENNIGGYLGTIKAAKDLGKNPDFYSSLLIK